MKKALILFSFILSVSALGQSYQYIDQFMLERAVAKNVATKGITDAKELHDKEIARIEKKSKAEETRTSERKEKRIHDDIWNNDVSVEQFGKNLVKHADDKDARLNQVDTWAIKAEKKADDELKAKCDFYVKNYKAALERIEAKENNLIGKDAAALKYRNGKLEDQSVKELAAQAKIEKAKNKSTEESRK